MSEVQNLLTLFHTLEKLKLLKRSGWVMYEIPEPESVADHTFRVAMMALILAEKRRLDAYKCATMALTHDLAEIYAGDLTPHDNVDLDEQHRRQQVALDKLLAEFPDNSIEKLWQEYEERQSEEAKLVYQIDKLEALLQIIEYKKQNPAMKEIWQEFFDYTKARIEDVELIEMMNDLDYEYRALSD